METRHALSEPQMAVMRVLWQKGEASAAQVHEALQTERPQAYTTVSTTLSRLEKRGIVTHRGEGRQYFYRALVAEDEVVRAGVKDLVKRLFGGDRVNLVSHLLRSEEMAPGDLENIQRMIDEARNRRES
ncbi:MAG: BlaI/MecI/CopY family transcriptional regulator [Acidobacteriota bacterium]|nr:BlaI/MecI/CopY family transcriptional regulator [Acidobacteriota bacterium]